MKKRTIGMTMILAAAAMSGDYRHFYPQVRAGGRRFFVADLLSFPGDGGFIARLYHRQGPRAAQNPYQRFVDVRGIGHCELLSVQCVLYAFYQYEFAGRERDIALYGAHLCHGFFSGAF